MNPLDPDLLSTSLDLTMPALRPVADALKSPSPNSVAAALLHYFRDRTGIWYPITTTLGIADELSEAMHALAEDALEHRFLARGDVILGRYGPQDYGAEVDWTLNPVQDINWLSCMHRFNWDAPLANAWHHTRDEKYAACWVDVTRDWIGKHGRDFGWTTNQQELTGWKNLASRHVAVSDGQRFAYFPLQIGVRSSRWCADFELYKSADSFTPEFLQTFLAAIHDHAEKTRRFPTRGKNNGTVVEIMGLLHIAIVFPEFKAAEDWFSRGCELLEETMRQQVTADGVHREFNINYHMGVTGWLINLLELCEKNGRTPDGSLGKIAHLVERMMDYTFSTLSPDRLYPMFGDARRPAHPIENHLRQGAGLFHKPQFTAVLDEEPAGYPGQTSSCYAEGGMYFLRSGWGRDDTYVGIHCSPPAESSHDQPDNGTFELHAFGEWLMPDSGCYEYGHGTPEAEERPWFCRTASHQTLTLNGGNSVNAARHLLWHSDDESDVVVFENDSYPELTHRRTIFFVQRRFLVILDEALGKAEGELELHFQFAPLPYRINAHMKRAYTERRSGGNILLCAPADSPVDMLEEAGQISEQRLVKQKRPAFAFRHRDARAPCHFITAVIPFREGRAPGCDARLPDDWTPGADKADLAVDIDGEKWRISRDLASGQAGCRPV